MLDRLKKYVNIPSVSGDEDAIRCAIIEDIKDYCEYKIDRSGNIIAFKKGQKTAKIKLQIDAHMDEVGLIITYITDDGYLKFSTVGGIDPRVIFGRRVKLGDVTGVIGGKAVHMLDAQARKNVIKTDNLYIDIGAKTKAAAETKVSLGDTAVFDYTYREQGDTVFARAIDDKAGCAILVEMIRNPQPYDMYFTFTVGEEVGCRGAVTASYTADAQSAIVVESTTAADIHSVADENRVCKLSKGAVASFMDNGTVYDKQYYSKAIEVCDNIQPKMAVAGGNNASAIHKSRDGVRTLALSVPCRYIHSQCCVANKNDILSVYENTVKMAEIIASGELN